MMIGVSNNYRFNIFPSVIPIRYTIAHLQGKYIREVQTQNQYIVERLNQIRAQQDIKQLTWLPEWHEQNPTYLPQDEAFAEDDIVDISQPTIGLPAEFGYIDHDHVDGLLDISEQLRGKYPELAIKLDKVQMKFIKMTENLTKKGVQLFVGSERITTEQARNLYVNWMSWKVQCSLTNNTLHYALDWIEDLKSKPLDKVCLKIQQDLSKVPEGNTWWNQWKYRGTMHRVGEFAVDNPEMCVAATKLIENILEHVEDQAEFHPTLDEFGTVARRNADVSSRFIACGLLLYKDDPSNVTLLLQQMETTPSLIYSIMHCATTFMKTIEGDEKAKKSVNALSEQIVQIGDKRPDLVTKVLKTFNDALAKNDELKAVAEATIGEVDQMMTEHPEVVKGVINAVPFLIQHPKLTQLAIRAGKAAVVVMEISSKAEEIKDRYHLHEDGMGAPMDFDDWEGKNPGRLNPAALELAHTALDALQIASEGIDPDYVMQPTSEEKTLVGRVKDFTVDIASNTWQLTRECASKEIADFPNIYGNAAGGRIGSALYDATSSYVSGNSQSVSFQEVAKRLGMGAIKCFGATVMSSAKKVGFETVKGVIATVLSKFAPPSVAQYLPGYQTASLVYRFGNSLWVAKSKEEAVENGIITLHNAAVVSVAAIIATDLVQDIEKPILSAFVAGLIGAMIIKGFSAPPPQPKTITASTDKTV